MADDRDGISRRRMMAGAAGAALGRATAEARGIGPAKLMVIRHAEKPDRDGSAPYGIDGSGEHDSDALLVRGWQRAGALARFFVPREGMPSTPGIASPNFLVAARSSPDHPSRRAGLTLAPLAALIGIAPDLSFGPDEEDAAAAAILTRSGVGLVAWEHKRIADLVQAVTGGAVRGPHWPSHRYDMVLVLDRTASGWRLTQVPQSLLAGDSVEPLTSRAGP